MIKKTMFFVLLASIVFAVPAFANEVNEASGPERIPYITALRSSLRNLPGITAFDDQIDDMTEVRDDLRSLLELRRVSGTLTRPEELQMQRQIANLGSHIQSMRVAQDTVRIGTEFSMRNSITTINNTTLDIELMEATLAYYQNNLNTAQLRFNAGLISESALQAAELSVQQRESNLAALLVNLESARHDLNRTLQRPVTDYVYIFFDRELMELPDNLDRHIRDVVSSQPNVRQREIAYNRARAYLSDLRTDFGNPVRAQLERERDQARREYNEIRRNVETAMRNHYNNLTAMLHNKESLAIDLTRALDRYEIATLNYQAGLATRFDIEAAERGVLAAEIALERTLNNFWNAQFLFENPFLIP